MSPDAVPSSRLRGAGILGAYGHSWAFGTGAARHDDGFVGLAARELDLHLENKAVSGSLSTELAHLMAADPPRPAEAYVVMTGFNDARLNGYAPAARRRYERALNLLFQALQEANPRAPVLAMEQPYILNYSLHAPFDKATDRVIDQYNRALRAVVLRHQSARLVTPDGWNPATMLADDTVHPNDRGHAHLAQSLVTAIRNRIQPSPA